MFEHVWQVLAGWHKSGKKTRPCHRAACRAMPRVELLEDRCLLSAALAISHMSNNNWTEGLTDFTGAMTISGGTGPFTLVSDGALPPGVTPVINGDMIDFTGPPSVAKTYSACTVTIKDASGATATKTFVIDVEPALIVGDLSQDQWTVGQAGFTGAMTIGGGTGPYSYVTSKGLPAGLTAEVGNGTVHFTGTPTTVGVANGSVTVADADGATIMQNFTITINPAPTLSPLTTLQWTAETPGYTGTVTINGGTAPYTISYYAYLPFSAAVSGNTVYFTGVAPQRVYTGSTFTIQDATGATVSETNDITVNYQTSLTTLTKSNWTVGQPGYNGTITINYGTQPFTITSFSSLPTGLTPIVSGGTISFTGTPSVAGAFGNGSIDLEDSGGETFTVPVAITINQPLTFTTTALPIVTDGASYGATLATTGGTGPDTFALTSLPASLPAGLTLQSNGHIGGTSDATGTFTFTATVTDTAGAHANATFSIAVGPAISLGNLTQTQWTVGQAGFTGTIAVKGGAGTFTLATPVGLPPGLTATLSDRTIKITGTPSATGTSAGSITVHDSDGVSVTEDLTITINADPTLGSLVAIPWTAAAGGYPNTIAINGGTGPYTIVGAHGLPFTPVVSGNSILLTGSGGSGTYANGSITLRDTAGATVTASIAPIVINPVLSISHMSVNNWTEGTPNFPGNMWISGGTGPFTIVTTKNVPLGLTPIVSGGSIGFAGTPEVAETVSNCSVTIRDAAGVLFTKVFVLDFAMPVLITTTQLPAWRSGVAYSTTLAATGGTGTDTFTLTAGSLPSGLTLKSNGKISGTATAIAPFTFTVTVTDSIGDKSIETFTL